MEKQFLLLIVLIFSAIASFGQSYNGDELPRFRHQAKIGYPIEIGLAPAFPTSGIHISYNPTYKLGRYLAIEGQASYSYADFKRNSNTFSRDGGDNQSLNILGGARLYLFGESRRVRLYGNILLGGVNYLVSEYRSGGTLYRDTGVDIGYSIGAYLQYQNTWSFGFSLETVQFLVAKGGYTF